MCALTAVDVLSTWHSPRALVDHQHLSVIMGAILIPSWIWLMISMFVTFPMRRSGGTRWPRTRDPFAIAEAESRRAQAKMVTRNMYTARSVPWVLLAVLVLCVCVIVTGTVLGSSKGSGYILPGPRYEITSFDLNGGTVTTVSAEQYAYWQARFVRLDAFFTVFGLLMITFGLGFLGLHRTARDGYLTEPAVSPATR